MKWNKRVKHLVVGGNLAALEFAFKNGYHIFYESLDTPFELEQTKEGASKKDILENYAFILSLAGMNLSSHLVYGYRIEENKLIVSGKNPWINELSFEKLHDFRDSNHTLFKVVDYINVRSCGAHDIRELKTEDNFVKEIYFYPSKRMNSSKNFSLFTHNYETVTKDAMVISNLTKEEIEKEEFSPVYSRLRLKEIMKEVGIKGKKCGTRPNGTVKRNAIKLEFDKREINPIEKDNRNYYYTKSQNNYLNKLFNYLYGRKNS